MVKKGLAAKYIGLLALLLVGINTSHAAFWQVDKTANRVASGNDAGVVSFIADDQGLRDFLDRVPAETSGQSLEIELPMPDGSLSRYNIYESSIMEEGLSVKFPDIKSYRVKGIDQPGSTGRVDISPKGFRGMVDTVYGRLFIDPESFSSNRYMSRTSSSRSTSEGFQCGVYDVPLNSQSTLREFEQSRSSANRVSGSLTTYRLAVSATPEYVTAVGGTLSAAIAEINTVINRVNQIYERDLGIRLLLVAGNDVLIDLNGDAGFSNDDGFGNLDFAILDENQVWINSKLGAGNYDIGHIFATGGGGVAQLQSVCSLTKARGATGLSSTAALMSDIFYIDYVAHEIGHQFGGNHTFNGSTWSCAGGNRNAATAFEPGSGSTIMGYAGICAEENLQDNSDATFHAGTIAEINAFVTNSATGGSCATILATSPVNNDPISVDAGGDKTIPASTSFSLVGSATDPDGDTLTYQWDQMDVGTATNQNTLGDDFTDNALFRSYAPQSSPERHFPALGTQIDSLRDLSEALPCTARDLNFRLTVRDGNSGQATDAVKLSVDDSAGPFRITTYNQGETIYASSGSVTLRWDVANTNNSRIACSSVDIDLLTFSSDHSTYAVTSLESATENDGAKLVTIPDMFNEKARFRVSCSNNVFYDISDEDLTIQDSGGKPDFPTTGNDTFFNENGTTFAAREQACISGDDFAGSSSGGGGSLNLDWLVALLGLIVVQSRLVGVRAYTQS